MLFLYCTLFTIAFSVSAVPSRHKRSNDDYDPYRSMEFPTYPFFPTFPPMIPFAGFPWFGGFGPRFPSYFPDYSRYDQYYPWFKGPNVCTEVKTYDQPEIMEEYQRQISEVMGGDWEHKQKYMTCNGNNEKHICMERKIDNGKEEVTMTIYKCCPGHVRSPDGRPGCVEIDVRYLLPTLRNMGASNFVKLVENVGLADDFYNNNYTVFCPKYSALDAMQRRLEDEIDSDVTIKLSQQKVKKKTILYNFLTSHIVPGVFNTDTLADGGILSTDNPECKIRVNVYFTPFRVITANCVPVISADNFARNGIIHVVEKLLPMPSKSVADIIAGDTQFSILKRMLSMAGLVQTLRNPNGSYTMFAPTDSALKSYFQFQKGRSNNRCTVNIMKHHIINHVICSTALPPQARSLNMIGELLSLNRDQDNKLYVDGVQIVVRDLMATNGVVHIIDGILSTHQTKPFSQVLAESGLSEFLSLLEGANLKSEFNSFENVTFFIPTDEVMKIIPPRHLEALLNYNNQSIQNVLRYHVVEGQAEFNTANQLLESKLENSTIRFQVHAKYPQMTPQILAQCANVLSANTKFCGGTLHVIDKLLFPPKQTITEFLESIEGFSTLVLLLRITGLSRRLDSEESAFTLFAPTDDAFYQMGEETIFRLLGDVEKARDLLKMHIMLGSVCCSQLNNDMISGRPHTRSMDGTQLSLDRSVDNILMIGGAHIVDCDIMTTNGVIHMVNAILSHDQTAFLGGGFFDNLFIFV